MTYRLALIAAAMGMIATVPLSPASQDSPPAAGGEGSSWQLPRTPWGDPDFQGIWTRDAVDTPMERPAEYGNREFLTAAEIAERERESQLAYERRLSEEDPAGPRSTSDAQRAASGFEAGIRGEEYNNFWMARPVEAAGVGADVARRGPARRPHPALHARGGRTARSP